MQLNRIKRYEFAAPGGGVSSVNGMTGDVVIGDVGGLTCFVNALGGNDYTAQPGNYLRPFQTLHGAVYAVQPGGAIEVFAGEYNETDATLPLGLLLHSYDFYFHPNTTVNYFGNYGLYISESWKSGNIYGYGKFNAYAPSFTNPYGAAFYIEIANTQKLFEFVFIIAAYDSSDSDNKAVRIGGCTSTGTNWTFSNRILSRRSVALTPGRRLAKYLYTNHRLYSVHREPTNGCHQQPGPGSVYQYTDYRVRKFLRAQSAQADDHIP